MSAQISPNELKLVPVGAAPCRFVARCPNLDQPIRRIFQVDRLLDAIRSSEMTLVAPRLWEDPREDPTTLCMLDGSQLEARKGQQQPLQAYLAPAWGQCWSLNPGSDTLLRAYSRVRLDPQTRRNSDRVNEGVTVTTTVRRLLAAAEAWHADGADGHIVIGRVEYLEDKQIWQRIVNACNGKHGPEFFRSVQGRADSLLWKRHYFDHEQEVRLLLIGRVAATDSPSPALRNVRIHPDLLFSSISFDPRLPVGEIKERETAFRMAGYGGEFVRDPCYQGILGLLNMTRDWPDP